MQNAIEHMNEDHADKIVVYARYHGKMPSAKFASIISIEGDIMTLLVNDKDKLEIKLPEVATLANIRSILVNMAMEGQGVLEEEKAQKLLPKIETFMESCKTITLATLDEQNNPYATYAPTVKYNGSYYIYISPLAEHFNNLKVNPKLEVMFIEDEQSAKMVIARTRARFKAMAEFLERDIASFGEIMDVFEQKVGGGIAMTRNMDDFRLVKLTFGNGRYVQGFGQAYTLTLEKGELKVSHIKGENGKGHGSSSSK